MLLQTLVQLNLLILATPALAGWTLLPLAQPGVVRVCVVTQGQAVEAVVAKTSPVEATRRQPAPPSQPVAWPSQAVAVKSPAAVQTACYALSDVSPVAPSHPFPHAARAP